MATMAVLRVENASRYGTVHVDASGRVTGFAEKTGSELPGLVNGGIYVFNHAVLAIIFRKGRPAWKEMCFRGCSIRECMRRSSTACLST